MCGRCEELEEEVAYLKSELGLQVAAGEVAALKSAFKITDHKARVLLILYRARSRVASTAQLDDALPARYEGTERSSNFVSATISQLRKIVGADAIETIYASGYRLSEDMRARVAAAIGVNSPFTIRTPVGGKLAA